MEALVLYIVRGLVDAPDRVEVLQSGSGDQLLFELKVAPEDVGKVIGRDGRTVNALRVLLSAAAHQQGVKASLELVDARRAAASRPGPASPA